MTGDRRNGGESGMTEAEFAKRAGFLPKTCDPEWGGRHGYSTTTHPNSTVCGFRTERAALRHWFKDQFGDDASKAVLSLLRKAS